MLLSCVHSCILSFYPSFFLSFCVRAWLFPSCLYPIITFFLRSSFILYFSPLSRHPFCLSSFPIIPHCRIFKYLSKPPVFLRDCFSSIFFHSITPPFLFLLLFHSAAICWLLMSSIHGWIITLTRSVALLFRHRKWASVCCSCCSTDIRYQCRNPFKEYWISDPFSKRIVLCSSNGWPSS